MDKSKISVILSEGWVGPRGAKDLGADRGSAPGFVRRSFAPTPAPTLSLRMTLGWFWALDNERRNPASSHKHLTSRGAPTPAKTRGSFAKRGISLSPVSLVALQSMLFQELRNLIRVLLR